MVWQLFRQWLHTIITFMKKVFTACLLLAFLISTVDLSAQQVSKPKKKFKVLRESSSARLKRIEEGYKNYFDSVCIESLDPIEGIWNVTANQEFYQNDILYDVNRISKMDKVVIMKKNNKYEVINITGQSYFVEFKETQVKGIYLYKNNFAETNSQQKTKAVINSSNEMNYNYDFPEEYLRLKFGNSFEEGTTVTNRVKWVKSFPPIANQETAAK